MLQKSNMSRTLEPFFGEPAKKHYLLDISRSINLAHTSVKKDLLKLLGAGLITKAIEKKGKRKFPVYMANMNSREFIERKKARNLQKIIESGLVDFLEERLSPKSIILFGSYSRGEDTEESDIDLFLEYSQEKIRLDKYERVIGRKIQLHFNRDFAKYPKELKNNIINGTVLSGFLEAYK